MLWLDQLFTAGLLFLIPFTPFAFGAVHPWAYTTMEVMIFLLVIVWMAKLWILRKQGAGSMEHGAKRLAPFALALPLALFTLLVLLQLVPLPPALLRAISPETYTAYTVLLPGWPEQMPYEDLPVADIESTERGAGSKEQGAQSRELGADSAEQGQSGKGENPTPNTQTLAPSVDSPIENPKSKIENPESASRLTPHASRLFPATWRPISFASFLTWPDLLKFLSFAALFFLVWRFPLGDTWQLTADSFVYSGLDQVEQRFCRLLLSTIVACGLLVAVIGFAAYFSSNGKILWILIPEDTGRLAWTEFTRASGPFVNPDHFANYLALILPMALAVALFQTFSKRPLREQPLRIFAGLTVVLAFTGILLSLSRGGWISVLVGVIVFVWSAPWDKAGSRERRARRREQGAGSREQGAGSGSPHASRLTPHAFGRVARLSAITVCILLIVSLIIAGTAGREQVDLRLAETLEQNTSLEGRIKVWRDTLPMIVDFPVLGVGLGAWPELFLRYQSPPWVLGFFREAHNDYVEILAETGFVGVGLLAWFFVVAARRFLRGMERGSTGNRAVFAGIAAALVAMAIHEWLDFNLQIPANAFLFTVLLALGLRLAQSREHGAGSPEPDTAHGSRLTPRESSRFAVSLRGAAPYAVGALALGLMISAVLQDQVSYPYNFKEPESLAEARDLVLRYPNNPPYHAALLTFLGEQASMERRLSELRAALWTEPTNPYHRDAFAAALMELGQADEALKLITQSVADSPSMKTHIYLADESLAELPDAQRAAVEQGFKEALRRNYPEALGSLAEFYAKIERFADQAALYEQAAAREPDATKKAELLIQGGLAYLRAERAEQTSEVRGQRSAEGREQSAKGEAQRTTATNAKNANATNASSASHASRLTPHAVSAERLFRAAIAATPSDPKPYQHLVSVAYVAESDAESMKTLVAKAIENGAPPLPLYLSMAEAAHKSGRSEESRAALSLAKEEIGKLIRNGESAYSLYMALADGARRAAERDEEAAALLKALDLQPRSIETLRRLADVYSARGNYDRMVLYLNRIANINPDSPEVFYRIAQAEEARYRFAAAGRAYARAVELAPSDGRYKERYDAFRARVAANVPERDAQRAKAQD